MKFRTYLFVFILFLVSCTKENTDNDDFVCKVDYVQFINSTSAKVNFTVSKDGVEKNYLVDNTYSKENENYFIGDELVRIENFIQNGSEATFDFYFGENLGPYCMSLFEAVPPHQHDPFNAEAEREDSDKTIGKWKIKKKAIITSRN